MSGKAGWFGDFGGAFVPEVLREAHRELESAMRTAFADASFRNELARLNKEVTGRPTPLYLASKLTEHAGGATIWLKREDAAFGGAHKINNTLGQTLLAKRMGKTRVIAETGAGQHGVATATAAALFDIPCVVYMGRTDTVRQSLNVARMKMLGAEVITVSSGTQTLKDAINEAFRDWVTNVRTTHYVIGSVVGAHPFPTLVARLQKVIGDEARAQFLKRRRRLPDAVYACVGGGSNAIGMFGAFLKDKSVKLFGVEAAGEGLDSARHSATLSKGSPGVLHGARSFVLQDDDGQILPAHSISAGLDYPGVGPQHANLKQSGRVTYESATDKEAVDAFLLLARTEGIIPALETAHALARAVECARRLGPGKDVVICLSGRGDKDVDAVRKAAAIN